MNEDEESFEQWPLTAEQYEAANQALEIFYSYLLENGDGPGTKQLIEDALGGWENPTKDSIEKLVAGLLAVAAALSAHWRVGGNTRAMTPQQIVDFVRKVFTPYE